LELPILARHKSKSRFNNQQIKGIVVEDVIDDPFLIALSQHEARAL